MPRAKARTDRGNTDQKAHPNPPIPVPIIGVEGISIKHGCTVPSNAEAEVVRQMIERTKSQIIIVADHSKWGIVSNFQIATIDEIDMVVTDEKFDETAIQSLVEHGLERLIVMAGPIKA